MARRSLLLQVDESREGGRVTTLELFFDLVFVFAFHQVATLVTHGDDHAIGLAQAVVVLALVWWSWAAFAWLSNQARADSGVVLSALVVAMPLILVIGLAIPQAFHSVDGVDGALSGALVFVVAYLLVRLIHAGVYLIAAGADRGLRRQVVMSAGGGGLPAAVLLIVGAFLHGAAQLWLWGIAIALDLTLVYVTSRSGRQWRVKSAAHFAERHGLVVILALGESVIAIGAEVGHAPLTWSVLWGVVLAVALAAGLWAVYFVGLFSSAEHAIARRVDPERSVVATDIYTYLHLVLVAGVIAAAIGIELTMAAVAEGHAAGAFAAWMIAGGIGIYLLGTVLIKARVAGTWLLTRIVAIAAVLALAPVWALAPASVGLLGPAVLLGLLLVVERVQHPDRPRERAQRRAG